MAKRYRFDAFMSYSTSDAVAAVKLKLALEERGVRVWMDRDEIRPGNHFVADLEAALEMCKSYLLLVSPSAVKSRWVAEEYQRAVSLAKRKDRPLQLIPVILGKAELPGFLATRNWVEILDESTFHDNLDRLVWGITGTKKRPRLVAVVDAGAPPAPASAPTNPYIFERPALGSLFFGRDSEIRRLVNALKDGRSVVVYGLQRVGKTSLVKEALDGELLPSEPGIRDVRLDMYESADNLTSYIDFFETFVDRLSDDLPPAEYKNVRQQAREILRAASDAKEMRTLIKNFVRALGRKYGRPLLYIDEFQDIAKSFRKADQLKTVTHPLDSGFVKYLGSLVKDGYVQLLCCGRYQIQMLDAQLDWQLLKLMVPIELGALDDASATRLIEEPARDRFQYSPAAVARLLVLSGAYPYLIQYLCYELVERARGSGRTTIEVDDVQALAEMVREPQLRLLYSDFQELDGGMPWRLLLSVAHHAETERQIVPWEAIADTCGSAFGVAASHAVCSHALTFLTNSRILAEASLPDTFGYYIQPDILRIWLRRKNYFFSERIGARSQHSAAVPRASSA